MTTVLLLRHGRTSANADGVLAGWTEGVGLDETGRTQVAALGERLAGVPLAAVISSPLERCVQTAAAVTEHHDLEAVLDPEIGECHYGAWTGRRLTELMKDELWRTVQDHPSAATFPPSPDHPSESIAQMQLRAMAALRRHDAHFRATVGEHAVWALVSHGDVIKAMLADCLGEHLDHFQRITVGPASLSAVRLTPRRPFVLRTNDTGSDPRDLVPTPEHAADSQATPGGGATAQG